MNVFHALVHGLNERSSAIVVVLFICSVDALLRWRYRQVQVR